MFLLHKHKEYIHLKVIHMHTCPNARCENKTLGNTFKYIKTHEDISC